MNVIKRINVDDGVKVILGIILISQLFFLNGIYLFACVTCFYLGIYYLQHPNKSSIFTIIFFYHFTQIYAGVCLATYLGNDINYRSPHLGFTTVISLIGLLIMFIPIAYYQNKIPTISYQTLKNHAEKLSLNKTFYAYVAVFFISSALNGIRFLLPGYTQFIITIVNLKWMFFLLFGFQSIIKKRRRKEFFFFNVLEFVLGLYSFFSDFKIVIFFTGLLFLTMLTMINIKKLIIFFGMAISIFSGATLWTTIKGEYRQFLNKGELSQNVSVSQNEAFTKLYELANTKGQQVLTSSTAKFLDRLQGTYLLSKTIDRVPDVIPYQNGANWGETFAFVFTPRLFNPNKPQLDASIKVSKYTGTQYAGLSQGTSFSLGYFADCYIDFGMYGMFLILFVIGLLYGITYFYFLRKSSSNFIFNYSVVCALYMRFFAFEMDNIFFIGGLFTDLLMYLLLAQFFFPWLYRYLLENKEITV